MAADHSKAGEMGNATGVRFEDDTAAIAGGWPAVLGQRYRGFCEKAA